MVLRSLKASYSLSLNDQTCIQALIIILPTIPKRGKWLKWIPHITGLKLNVDGSAIDLNSAVGGCIRDSAGFIVLAFSCNFGQGNNMEAEAKALLQGFS